MITNTVMDTSMDTNTAMDTNMGTSMDINMVKIYIALKNKLLIAKRTFWENAICIKNSSFTDLNVAYLKLKKMSS